jgi:hypothetical protein
VADRVRHILQTAPKVDGHKRWRCEACGSVWSSARPATPCPRMPLFRAQEHGRDKAWTLAHQAGLYTRTQWKKRRRIVLDGEKPSAIYDTRDTWLQLFTESQTRPVKGSEAQLEMVPRG